MALSSRRWFAVRESASEQPELWSGTMTVASGERILAVSAMKTTPEKTIVEARAFFAWRLRK